MSNAAMPANLPYWIPAYYTGGGPNEYNAALNAAVHDIGIIFPQNAAALSRVDAPMSQGMVPFTAQQQAFVWAGLRTYEGIIDVKFSPSSDANNVSTISFLQAPLSPGIVGIGNPLKAPWFPGSVTIDPSYAAPGTNGEARLVSHELMHALGLGHPSTGLDQIKPMDNGGFWTNVSNTTTDTRPLPPGFHSGDGFVPRPLDIAALQYLYGPSKTTRTGNDIYKLVENSANFIWDGGGGTDTIDGQLMTKGMTIDLNPGTWGHIGAKADYITAAGQVTVNYGSVIENVVGTHHDDVIIGNGANNYLMGLSGNDIFKLGKGTDTVDGGVGLDTVVLTGARGSYVASKVGAAVKFTSAVDGAKTLTEIDRVQFNNGTDGIAYDVKNGGVAGDTIKLLAVCAGIEMVSNKDIAGVGIALRDAGLTRDQVSEAAINAMVGPTGSNLAVVDQLMFNLTGVHHAAADLQDIVGLLDYGVFTRGSLTTYASDIMDANFGLIGVNTTLDYIPTIV